MTAGGGGISLRDFLEQRFNSLDRRLDDHCNLELAREIDQEARLRTLERRQPIRNAIEIITGVAAAVGVALGFRQ